MGLFGQSGTGSEGYNNSELRIIILDFSNALATFDPLVDKIPHARWGTAPAYSAYLGLSEPGLSSTDTERLGLPTTLERVRPLIASHSLLQHQETANLIDHLLFFAELQDKSGAAALNTGEATHEPLRPGKGDLVRKLLALASTREPGTRSVPDASWSYHLAVLAAALLGKACTLISEIEAMRREIADFGVSPAHGLQSPYVAERLVWLQRLALESHEAVVAAEELEGIQHGNLRRSLELEELQARRTAEYRALKRKAHRLYLTQFSAAALSNEQIALRLWGQIEAQNRLAGGRKVLPGARPEATVLPQWIALFRAEQKFDTQAG